MGDGRPVERSSRRDALGSIGAAGFVALVGCGGESRAGAGAARGGGAGAGEGPGAAGGTTGGGGSGPCVVTPAQTEGPYFVDAALERSDIRSDPASGELKAGVPLRVAFRVSMVSGETCLPLEGAVVDLWQCDALGVYSDVLDTNGSFDTRGQRFLRGFQATDASGVAEFLTIYPGWYTGRTPHLHFKVRTIRNGSVFEFTSQLYFEESVNDRVTAEPPYDSRGARSTLNAMDGIFVTGGHALILPLVEAGEGHAGTFELALLL